MDSQLTRLLCPWDSPGKNTGMGSHSLLQGIFLTQGLNPHLLLCRQILYHWQAPRKAYKVVTFMLCEFPLNRTHTHIQLPISQNHPPSPPPSSSWGPPPASCSSPFKSQGAPPDSRAPSPEAPLRSLNPGNIPSLPTANWNAVPSPSKSEFSVFLYFPTDQSLVLLYKAVCALSP